MARNRNIAFTVGLQPFIPLTGAVGQDDVGCEKVGFAMAYCLRTMGVGRLIAVMVGCGLWASSARVMANPADGILATAPVLTDPVAANPVSTDSVLANPVAANPVLTDSVAANPTTTDSVAIDSVAVNHLDGCTSCQPRPSISAIPANAELWPRPEVAQSGQGPSPAVDPLAAPLTEEELAPLDLDPTVIEQSPVLRRWLDTIPDIAEDIRHQPSFRTRLRVGYANFPSSGEISGFQVGVEDVFLVPGTGLTASGDYSRSGNGQRESYGAEARYYLMPLGGYVNVAPTLGYRSVSTAAYSTDGLDVGLRLMLIPSRGGAADFSLSQHWVAPGTDREVGITSLALGYAVTSQLRLGSDLQFQNSRFGRDSRWGLVLEWLL